MTPDQLEVIVDASTGDRRATAMAALTLARVLAPSWTHVVNRKTKDGVHQETIVKPSGDVVGDRASLQQRLDDLVRELEEAP